MTHHWIQKEERATPLPNGSVPISADNFFERLGYSWGGTSASGINVTVENALGVPAVWAATNFMAGTLAGLPLNLYRRKGENRERVKTGIAPLLHDAPNDFQSSFDWRKFTFDQVFTGGRGFTYIERNASGRVVNLFPLEPERITVKQDPTGRFYDYRKDGGGHITYGASEIIDLPFMLKSDGCSHRGPIMTNKDAVGLAIAATNYGSKFFQNGGVPPFIVEGGFQSPAAMNRATGDFEAAIKKASAEGRSALVLPTGLTAKPIGANPDDSQLVDLQRFAIEQIARIYSIPPTFLQDLTHGTFSNTEQQDLHFVKHTIRRWCEQFEQELNLKLFGRGNNRMFVEFNLDGLLRGDFRARMEGYSTAVQNALMTPNEVRRKENMAAHDDGDNLMIQGGTVPISAQMNLPLDPGQGEQ